uniref:Uncharacterized protein n=1 Tax=Globodera rostochiensis TaxID=31243 RepID=A0A914HPK3_GLORO
MPTHYSERLCVGLQRGASTSTRGGVLKGGPGPWGPQKASPQTPISPPTRIHLYCSGQQKMRKLPLICRGRDGFSLPKYEIVDCSPPDDHCFSGFCHTDREKPNEYYYIFGCAEYQYNNNECRNEIGKFEDEAIQNGQMEVHLLGSGKRQTYGKSRVISAGCHYGVSVAATAAVSGRAGAPLAAVQKALFAALLIIGILTHFFHGTIFTDHQSFNHIMEFESVVANQR